MASQGWRSWVNPQVTVTVEEADCYRPVQEAGKRAQEATQILQLLCAGRDSENQDLTSSTGLRLRKSFLIIVRTYASHQDRFDRDWGIPTWHRLSEVQEATGRKAAEAILRFQLDEFLERQLTGIRHRVAICAAVCEHFAELKVPRSKTRELNQVLSLFAQEVRMVEWATVDTRPESGSR